ncbi:hypothetical protein RHGRI_015074 [Rhododendron griersonianum]|uniref:Pentatricopeptide repeat-containing protein n=1 Tax=Rhododendron griersonianum TaxID=479676 RepID=A0AAV6KBX2_9ERIC|nr:hypothetical protein RHGRI_015074 [Rhododendron griersonianum]
MGAAARMSSPAPIARVANTPLPADSVIGTRIGDVVNGLRPEGGKKGACSTLVSGLQRKGFVDEALMVFRQFKDKGIDLNALSCTYWITACSRNGKDMEAFGPIQTDANCWGCTRNLVSWNAILGGYANAWKSYAIEIFQLIQRSGQPDLVSFTEKILLYGPMSSIFGHCFEKRWFDVTCSSDIFKPMQEMWKGCMMLLNNNVKEKPVGTMSSHCRLTWSSDFRLDPEPSFCFCNRLHKSCSSVNGNCRNPQHVSLPTCMHVIDSCSNPNSSLGKANLILAISLQIIVFDFLSLFAGDYDSDANIEKNLRSKPLPHLLTGYQFRLLAIPQNNTCNKRTIGKHVSSSSPPRPLSAIILGGTNLIFLVKLVPESSSVFIFKADSWKSTLHGDKLASRNIGL